MKTFALAAVLCASVLLTGCGGGGGSSQSSAADQPVRNSVEPSPEPIPAQTAAAEMEPAPDSEHGPVVFIGDSITALWDAPPGINVGISRQVTEEMLNRFERDVLSLRPEVVAILGGTNDVMLFENPTIDHVASMAEMAAASGACVIIGTLPPIYFQLTPLPAASTIDRWNEQIEMLASAYGYKVADYNTALSGRPELYQDGLHPNAEGYEVLRGVVQPLIDQCEAR